MHSLQQIKSLKVQSSTKRSGSLTIVRNNNNSSVVASSRTTGVAPRRTFTTNGPVPLSKLSESFLNGTSAEYVEQQYRAWRKNPESVHTSWSAFFNNVEVGSAPGQAYMPPPSFYDSSRIPIPAPSTQAQQRQAPANAVADNLGVVQLIDAYRSLGHRQSTLDPLGLKQPQRVAELEYSSYGLTEADLSKEFYFSDSQTYPFSGQKLSDIINRLRSVYCSTYAVQFMHIEDARQRNWLKDRVESGLKSSLTKDDKRLLLDRLIWADAFEKYLQKKWGQDKRFGLDGCETLIPGMKTVIDTVAEFGAESVVIGMPHRGRLNVLANVIRKPLEHIMKEFEKSLPSEELKKDFSHSGDVKYHLGTSYDRTTHTGKHVHLSLMSNPSHLEAVDPLVEGKARAKQYYANDTDRSKVMSLQLHGDAAFSGQGIVYEVMQMSGLPNYTTGGTVHIVVNNQIGFTTNPSSGRSTTYCTDIAKGFNVPVFHAVIAVCKLAAEWRQTFHKDVIIDIVCYRRFGHNELDEPRFTQPLMYDAIAKQQGSIGIYTQKILQEGVMSQEEIKVAQERVNTVLEGAYANTKSYKSKQSDWLESKWKNFKGPEQISRIRETGVSMEILKKVGSAIYSVPENFVLHPSIARDIKKKKAMIEAGEPVDWATAEALAFGTLLLEDNHVRLSGQDVERGTFSHRHAVLHDQTTGQTYVPLNYIDPKQAKFIACNSLLSEYAVMGFELGYSLENPNALVLWEAQFGDFANGAQIIIDQFLAAGEQKWYRQSGLVLLLPHGYDGQGPEHSSCRLERFLQLCDSDPNVIPNMDPATTRQIQESNMQVVNCTTPANYYHVLRRQVHREFRKPLVIATPKSLLRSPLARSPLLDFDDKDGSTHFLRVIGETDEKILAKDPKSIRKVVFCTGKVYYDIVTERAARKIDNIAVVRLEQLSPFPFDLVQEQVKRYSKAQFVWCQEEPMNQGAWTFVNPHFLTALKEVPKYVGRNVSASPAVGSGAQHKIEQANLVNQALA